MKRKGFDFGKLQVEDAEETSPSKVTTAAPSTSSSAITFQVGTQEETAAETLQRLNSLKVQVGQESKDATIFTCDSKNDDFDTPNEQFESSRHHQHSSQQDKTAIITDPNQYFVSQQKLKEIFDQSVQQKKKLYSSKQAVIAGRLARIRSEIQQLKGQLAQNQTQQQSGSGDQDIKQLEAVSKKLEHIYGMNGFKDLLKRPDLFDQLKHEKVVTQPDSTGLESILQQLTQSKTNESVDLVVDHSKKDIGILIKLHSLQKRVHFINHVLGGWKPTSRFQTLTHQIEQVQRFLELMDAQKIQHYQTQAEVLLDQLQDLSGNNMSAEDRIKDYGHPKDLHEKLFQSCQSVKLTYEELPKYVERMEQRKKVHEVCAKVMLGVAELETQQRLMIDRFGENSELMKEVRQGMAENLDICKANLKLIK